MCPNTLLFDNTKAILKCDDLGIFRRAVKMRYLEENEREAQQAYKDFIGLYRAVYPDYVLGFCRIMVARHAPIEGRVK